MTLWREKQRGFEGLLIGHHEATMKTYKQEGAIQAALTFLGNALDV